MAIRLNLFCNGQIAVNSHYLDNFDQMKWGPGGIKRDALGLPVFKGENGQAPSKEKVDKKAVQLTKVKKKGSENANLQK